jgi:Arc/MetJ family transcription regulator
MSTRLQVVMDDEELREVHAAAEHARLTTSEWVRRVLREARGGRGAGASGAEADRVRERSVAWRDEIPSRSPVLVDDRLVTLVMERYRFPTRHAAVEFALERAAEPPMTRGEMLAMEGSGWSGDLDEIRRMSAPRDDPA